MLPCLSLLDRSDPHVADPLGQNQITRARPVWFPKSNDAARSLVSKSGRRERLVCDRVQSANGIRINATILVTYAAFRLRFVTEIQEYVWLKTGVVVVKKEGELTFSPVRPSRGDFGLEY